MKAWCFGLGLSQFWGRCVLRECGVNVWAAAPPISKIDRSDFSAFFRYGMKKKLAKLSAIGGGILSCDQYFVRRIKRTFHVHAASGESTACATAAVALSRKR